MRFLLNLLVSAFFLGPGCQNSDETPPCSDTTDCGAGQRCVQYTENGPVCAVVVAAVEASDFDQTCVEDADCALVFDGDPCAGTCCGPYAPINAAAKAEFEEAWEAAQGTCTVIEWCGSLTPRTKRQATTCGEVEVACREGQCRAKYPDGDAEGEGGGFLCDTAADCIAPENCSSGTCKLPPACTDASDCPNAGVSTMLCDGGYCRTCNNASECGADAECWESRYSTERPRPLCVARDDIHAQCLDQTCPVYCQGGRDYVDCAGELPSPRTNGFDQSCEADSDCVALLQRYWHPVDTGRDQCECHCFWQTVNESAETAYTATFIDMKAEVGCGGETDCDCPPRPAVCSNGTCRIE